MKYRTDYVGNIFQSGLSIYDPITIGDSNLWIPSTELERILDANLTGLSVYGLPIRRRSKVVKEAICRALGYPVPNVFKKTKPRFLGQDFDTYIQKSNNLQIWNEEIAPTRRYVIIRVSQEDIIQKVKVITGADLAPLDTTGTLTRKYQARMVIRDNPISTHSNDTINIEALLQKAPFQTDFEDSPSDYPSPSTLLPISEIDKHLQTLIGFTFPDSGYDKERTRGAILQQLICEKLGYRQYHDDGRYPDIRNQLLEVKLQTSPTIDLGLISPASEEPLDIPQINGRQIRFCDVRYAIFSAYIEDGKVILDQYFLITGEDFFRRFPQFQGNVLNQKIQIPLPGNFFNR